MSDRAPLVVSTRPAERAAPLLAQLAADGVEALSLPVLAMRPTAGAGAPPAGPYDVLVFVSPSAVQFGAAVLATVNPAARLVAVGDATRRALEAGGFDARCPADGSTSEAVLAMEEVRQLRPGQRVLIVRGTGGRELMRETLAARGVAVDLAEVYERVRQAPDTTALRTALRQRRRLVLVLTSGEGIDSLRATLDAASWDDLRAVSEVVTYSERLVQRLRAEGFDGAIHVLAPGDSKAVSRLASRLAADGAADG